MLQEAVQTEQNYKQILVFTLFLVAYMLALYIQVPCCDLRGIGAPPRPVINWRAARGTGTLPGHGSR